MTEAPIAVARGLTELTEGVVLATVDVAASPERVFTALTDPTELVQWWGVPGEYRSAEWTIDLRVGGRWELRGYRTDGHLFLVEGEYLAIEAPTRLVLRWRPSWEPGPDTTVSYRLEAIPGGTRITLRHDGFETGDVPPHPGIRLR
jgi:uncharacterized protein YndB with AHSA1/START domain